ncbi:MAG: molecular chaperone DnaJ [Leptolyngbya sp.]|nr:MAG: molecular chaperone DnaJ [Leptolyngbya sp.]
MATTHYALLKIHPSASVKEIRQAYRELSKLYHPDTTMLPTEIATAKFQQLNEAYATLTSEERRTAYNLKIRYSSIPVVRPLPSLHQSSAQNHAAPSSAYIDATDRPLSSGELFALFILGLTFVGCLCLAIAIGLTHGDTLIQPITAQPMPPTQPVITQPSIPIKNGMNSALPKKL